MLPYLAQDWVCNGKIKKKEMWAPIILGVMACMVWPQYYLHTYYSYVKQEKKERMRIVKLLSFQQFVRQIWYECVLR